MSVRARFQRRASPGAPRVARAHPLGRRVWTIGRLLILAAALAGTYGIFFLTALKVATRAREVEVPDLQGRSIADASDDLARLGLTVRVEPLRRPDPKIAADHVIWQDPEPGSITRRQRSVRVRLSEGQQAPELPAIAGRAERMAEVGLSEAGIEVVSRAAIRTADYPAGSIVAQDPPPGDRASRVSLLVNRGERSSTYVMPDLIGTPGRQAIAVLRARGFRATIVAEIVYPGLPSGIVIRQSPQAGYQIAFGETISLEVSR
jgi:serine/threonine-protein kinase